MVLNLPPILEASLKKQAELRGIAAEQLALQMLQEALPPTPQPIEPRDEWERKLFGCALSAGVSVPDWVLSSDGLYE